MEVINLQKKYQDREVFAHPVSLCILKNQRKLGFMANRVVVRLLL